MFVLWMFVIVVISDLYLFFVSLFVILLSNSNVGFVVSVWVSLSCLCLSKVRDLVGWLVFGKRLVWCRILW